MAAALRPDTVLVSIMHANNETGVMQDIAAIGALVPRARRARCTCDAAQSAGKVPVDVARAAASTCCPSRRTSSTVRRASARCTCAHAARATLQPLIFGGGQERGLRPGTLPVHQIVGFGVACELARSELAAERARLTACASGCGGVSRLWACTHMNGRMRHACPGILNVSFEGIEGESLLAGLAELAVSTGSACNSASDEPSYVLRALGRDTRTGAELAALQPRALQHCRSRHRHRVAAVRARGCAAAGAVAGAQSPPGVPGRPAGQIVTGEAGGPGQEHLGAVQLQVAGGVVKERTVPGLGCPHTLAIAAWLAERLRGRGRAAPGAGDPGRLGRGACGPGRETGPAAGGRGCAARHCRPALDPSRGTMRDSWPFH